MRNFYTDVYQLTRAIPPGRVATYGQIAAALGSPRAARMVGTALSHCANEPEVPWQRVVNRHGMISIENLAVPKEEQAHRLQEEGVVVQEIDGNFFVDLNHYLVDTAILTHAR